MAASSTFTNTTQFTLSILNSTNTYRAQHNASALEWNTTLASYAYSLAQKCIFAHSGGPYGENLAAGYADATASVDAWGDEQAEYDYDEPGFSEETGHFTQLVWRDTTSTGCAAVDCKGQDGESVAGTAAPGWFVVCEYWPRGNVLGEFGEEIGRPTMTGDAVGTSGDVRRVINGGEIGGVLMVGLIMVLVFLLSD